MKRCLLTMMLESELSNRSPSRRSPASGKRIPLVILICTSFNSFPILLTSSLAQQQDMAQAEGTCYINDLADELFAMILDLVPITDVFVDMRVSKRWEYECRQAVRTRQSLTIGGAYIRTIRCIDYDKMRGWDWHKDPPSQTLDKIIVAHETLVPMMESLKRMTSVKRLCVSKISYQNVREFIRRLADQLTMLGVDFAIGNIAADIVFPHLTHLHCRHFGAETASAFPKLAELMIKDPGREQLSNMRLSSLKRLLCVGCPDEELIRPLILSNSENLEFLHVSDFELKWDRAVVFKNMIDLNIGSVNVDAVKSLPAIRRLCLQEDAKVAVLDRLPAAQMLSLDIRFDFDPAASDEEDDEDDEVENEKKGPDEFATVISQMSNLKQLSIYDAGQYSPNANKDPYHALSSMFDKLRQLEKVSIITKHARFSHSVSNGDSVVFSLVQQNPNLSDVCLHGIHFTTAAFTSLAQLQHLSHIELELFVVSENVSISRVMTEYVLKLLRGSSRKVIHKLILWKGGLNIAQVTRELKRMAKERGTTFENYGDRYLSEYEINV